MQDQEQREFHLSSEIVLSNICGAKPKNAAENPDENK